MNTEQQQDFQIALQAYLEHLNKLYAGKYTSLVLSKNANLYFISIINICEACDGYGNKGNCKQCGKEFLTRNQGWHVVTISKEGVVQNSNNNRLIKLGDILGNILSDMPVNIKPIWRT